MQSGNLVAVRAPSGAQWTGALAQNAADHVRLRLPEAIAAGRHGRAIIRSIVVSSFDQNDWEFWFWKNKLFQSPSQQTLEALAGFWSFAVAGGDGKRIGAAGLYYYYIDGLAIPYETTDAVDADRPFLNVSLVNRSAGAKTANGWFDATFLLELTLGV